MSDRSLETRRCRPLPTCPLLSEQHREALRGTLTDTHRLFKTNPESRCPPHPVASRKAMPIHPPCFKVTHDHLQPPRLPHSPSQQRWWIALHMPCARPAWNKGGAGFNHWSDQCRWPMQGGRRRDLMPQAQAVQEAVSSQSVLSAELGGMPGENLCAWVRLSATVGFGMLQGHAACCMFQGPCIWEDMLSLRQPQSVSWG